MRAVALTATYSLTRLAETAQNVKIMSAIVAMVFVQRHSIRLAREKSLLPAILLHSPLPVKLASGEARKRSQALSKRARPMVRTASDNLLLVPPPERPTRMPKGDIGAAARGIPWGYRIQLVLQDRCETLLTMRLRRIVIGEKLRHIFRPEDRRTVRTMFPTSSSSP
jgi:hypothetical protein